jgi:hypothetical protein
VELTRRFRTLGTALGKRLVLLFLVGYLVLPPINIPDQEKHQDISIPAVKSFPVVGALKLTFHYEIFLRFGGYCPYFLGFAQGRHSAIMGQT